MSSDYTLAFGTHATPEEGRCAMEWVSYLAGEAHSDDPTCVSPVLRAFCTTLNDSLDNDPRQRLRPYLTRTIGTADDGLDESRSWLALDWLIRTYTPTWLAAAGLTEAATRIEALPTVSDVPSLHAALGQLEPARADARGTWAAALGAPRIAARAAPWAAGRAAARESAWASAAAAAWAAARLAIGDMGGDRARAAAREIAGDAAAAIARDARSGTSRAAARDAARAALAPTLAELRESVFALMERMLPMVPLALPVAREPARVQAANR
jgi:hypothetical protein